MNKIIFVLALLLTLPGCSPEQPSKPGPGPKPPVVNEIGPETTEVWLDQTEGTIERPVE